MRIIAGTLKGRRLKPPTWTGLRPTSDKLRETLFNVLAGRMSGARVFDGYSGTGAIGIEALSRGAAHVTFVEHDRRATALIADNLRACAVTAGYTIDRNDVSAALAQLPGDSRFDVMVFDPPYEASALRGVLAAAARHLSDGAVLVLERATRTEPDIPESLTRMRDIRSGDSTLTLLKRAEESE